MSKIEKTEEQWKQELDSETYRSYPAGGYRGGIFRQILGSKGSGHVQLRRLWRGAVHRLETKYDFGLRLAQLLRPGSRDGVVGENA